MSKPERVYRSARSSYVLWNPWHGCHKISPGCAHCYMYYLDKEHGKDGSTITRNKSEFDLPLKKNRKKEYKITSGKTLAVCMISDFFLEEADEWRERVWSIMRARDDLKYFFITKRPERIRECLPKDWGDGWENVILNITAENQEMADRRIPILLDLPLKHRGIVCAPILSPIFIRKYLMTGKIESVSADGQLPSTKVLGLPSPEVKTFLS